MNNPNSHTNKNNPNKKPIPSPPEDDATITSPHNNTSDNKKTNTTDKIIAFATVIIMIATTAYSIIAHKQWKVMERQTDAAFKQLSAAKSSIRIADDALRDARESGKEQSNRTERLTKANEIIAQASKRSAEQSRASLEASTKQAQAALDTSREAASLDQRAWVGLVGVETVGGEQTSDAFRFKSIIVAIRNSGKTPALQMSGECCMYVNRPWADRTSPDYDTETRRIEEERSKHDEERRNRNEEEIKKHPEMADRIREFEKSYSQATEYKIPTGGVLAPGIVNNVSVAPSMQLGRARKPEEPPQTLYVLGRFTYTDIFTGTKRHSTKFCLIYRGGDSFSICPESNWMD